MATSKEEKLFSKIILESYLLGNAITLIVFDQLPILENK